MEKLYSISELAKELGVTQRAVRFYEDRGLIAPRRAGNARVYTHRERARMMLILRGKRLGFSLKEIREFLDLYGADATHIEQMGLLAAKVRTHIAHLEDQRVALDQTLSELHEIERLTAAALADKAT